MGGKAKIIRGGQRRHDSFRHKHFIGWVIKLDKASWRNNADGFARELQLAIAVAGWIEVGKLDRRRLTLWCYDPAHKCWPGEPAVALIGGHATRRIMQNILYPDQVARDRSVFVEIPGA
ncbi:hypothetical protein ABAC460_17305 [Asticcacaulis sp. AC460]|nr:hypothetical protein ABAC460_17305 [Asticcacaulis sp. AC460]